MSKFISLDRIRLAFAARSVGTGAQSFAEAHYQLGGIYYELGAYDKELSNFEKAAHSVRA